MSRATRLFELVHLLSAKRSYRARDLAQRFGVSERTIFRDLSELSTSGIPLVHAGEGYRLMEGALVRPVPLTAEERAILQLVLNNPALDRSAELRTRLDRLAAKIQAGDLRGGGGGRPLRLDGIDRSGAVGPAVMRTLESAVESLGTVEIDYVSLRSGKRSRRAVDPYAIFHRAEAWYLMGRCHHSDEPRMFRLDRIGSASPTGATFEVPRAFDLDAILRDAWSLYHGEELREIVIHFDRSLAPLIGNARHHEGEQITRLAGGDLEYRVTLAHLEEIARWIVAFGGKARAMEPPELVAMVGGLAEDAARAHRDRHPLPMKRAKAAAAQPATRAAKTVRR